MVITPSIHSDRSLAGHNLCSAYRHSRGKKMKFRMIALAGAAALAVSTPAMAEGWYLGLGGGLDWQNKINRTAAIPSGSTKQGSYSGGIGLGSFGYQFDNNFRVE